MLYLDPFGRAKPPLRRRGKEAQLRVNPEQAIAFGRKGVEGLTPGLRPHIVKGIGIIQRGLGKDGRRACFLLTKSREPMRGRGWPSRVFE